MPIAPNTNNTEYREARLRRLEIIQDLQRQTLVRFGSEGYNVFLFGSFTDFYPEELELFREECKKLYDKCEKIAIAIKKERKGE